MPSSRDDSAAAGAPAPASGGTWDVPAPVAAKVRGPVGRLLAAAWEDKAWWIVPMVVTLAALFTLVFVASRQQVAPFFYAVNG